MLSHVWWLICAMSYKRVFGLKTRKVATQKLAKWWGWRVFAWRPFVPPGKDTTNSSRKRNAWNVAYLRVAGRKVAMRNTKKSPFGGFSRGDLSPRHPKIRHIYKSLVSCFCLPFSHFLLQLYTCTWHLRRGVFSRGDVSPGQAKTRQMESQNSPLINVYNFRLAGQKVATRNTPNSGFGGFSSGDLSPRQAKIRQTVGENATHKKVSFFRVAGQKVVTRKHKKWPFGGFKQTKTQT